MSTNNFISSTEQFLDKKLEPIYLKIQELNQQINELQKSSQKVIVTGGLLSKQPQPLKVSLQELICLYNYVPQVLSEYTTSVNLTKDSYQQKTEGKIYVEVAEKGYYWVFLTEDEQNKYYWLLPNGNIKISLHRLKKSVESLFVLQGEKPYKNSEFILEQPARLSILSSGTRWELIAKGEIQVGKLSPAAKLLTELEKITKTDGKVPEQLEELQQIVEQANNTGSLIHQQNECLELDFQQQKHQLQEIENQYSEIIKKLKAQLEQQRGQIGALWVVLIIAILIIVFSPL
jgi:hypothetical protein